MTLVRELGSEILAQFTTPILGTWRYESVAVHEVPPKAVADSLNIFIRGGKLRSRPGLTLYNEDIFLEPIIGGGMIVTPGEKIVLAVTRNRIYQLSDIADTWSVLNLTEIGTTIAPSDRSVVDITVMESSGVNIAILAQQDNILKQWIAAPRAITTITGTNIPKAKSVCIAASRVIALIPPHTVVWSNTNNPTIFDPLAINPRPQTGDAGILVESLSSLSFVLYKDRSIHVARAQAGLDESTAFSFSEPIYADGPAGIYSLVNVFGTHIYMTHNGRIALFDGTRYPIWIADGLWFFLQNDIEPQSAYLIRAMYDYRLHVVVFFYPKKGYGPGLRGMVVINLPFEGQDIQGVLSRAAFLGISNKGITHTIEKRWDSDNTVDRALLFNDKSSESDRHHSFLFDENCPLDEHIPFTSSFQTGLQPMPDARHTTVTVESFFERSQGYGSVFIEPVISDALENTTGTIPDNSGQWIDLETNPVREYKGFGGQVRFFGLRYTWQSDNHVRYSGAVVYGSNLPKFKR